MQTTRTQIEPLAGHGRRIVGEDGGVVHVALTQAHTAPILEIDGGNQQHDITGRERGRAAGTGTNEQRIGRKASGPPVEEIGIKTQATGCALFRMELGGKDVIPRHRTGKAKTMEG